MSRYLTRLIDWHYLRIHLRFSLNTSIGALSETTSIIIVKMHIEICNCNTEMNYSSDLSCAMSLLWLLQPWLLHTVNSTSSITSLRVALESPCGITTNLWKYSQGAGWVFSVQLSIWRFCSDSEVTRNDTQTREQHCILTHALPFKVYLTASCLWN